MLKTVVRTQGNTEALKDGRVRLSRAEMAFVEVSPLIDAFRRMVRRQEFDVCEMAMATYLSARAHGKPFTAIPVFVMRAFHHAAIVGSVRAGLRNPKQLEGQRVGVARGYTVTTGLWARSILAHQYGVNLDSITWVVSGDEHVAEFIPPSNVERLEKGKTLQEMVLSGDLAAAIGIDTDHPDLVPLIPDPVERAFEALGRSGHYPINHTVVVRDELLNADSQLAVDLFEAFMRAKQLYVRDLEAETRSEITPLDRVHKRVMTITGRDPLPYGIGPNREMLEEFIRSAVEQQIIPVATSVEALFPPATWDLRG